MKDKRVFIFPASLTLLTGGEFHRDGAATEKALVLVTFVLTLGTKSGLELDD